MSLDAESCSESDGVGTPVEIPSLQWGKRGKSSSYVTPDRLRKKAQDVVITIVRFVSCPFLGWKVI